MDNLGKMQKHCSLIQLSHCSTIGSYILGPMIFDSGLQLVRDYESETVNLLTKPSNPWMVCATAITLGHCTVDIVWLFYYKTLLLEQRVYTGAYWIQMDWTSLWLSLYLDYNAPSWKRFQLHSLLCLYRSDLTIC